jgi:hypothetical protein
VIHTNFLNLLKELSLEDALELLTPYLSAELGEIGAQLELSV